MNKLIEWKDKLRAEGIRCTKQRIEILKILINQTKPLTAKEIYIQVKKDKVDLRLSTIYRNLNIFNDYNLVKKLSLNSKESKFELLGPYHHHHLVCVNCDEVTALDCPLEGFGKELGAKTGYKIEDHNIKFYGICPECQNQLGES